MLDLLPTSPSRTVLGQIFPFDFVEYLNAANCLEGAVSEVIKFQVWGKKRGRRHLLLCVCVCQPLFCPASTKDVLCGGKSDVQLGVRLPPGIIECYEIWNGSSSRGYRNRNLISTTFFSSVYEASSKLRWTLSYYGRGLWVAQRKDILLKLFWDGGQKKQIWQTYVIYFMLYEMENMYNEK